MKFSGRAFTSLLLMVIIGLAVIRAFSWSFNTALFPVVIGIPVFFLAMSEMISSLSERKGMTGDQPSRYGRPSRRESEPLPVNRTLSAFLLILGFFFLILLLGFPMAAPLFVFLYLRVYGREKWLTSIGLAVIAWVCFYGLFIRLLNIPFEEGWLQQGLGALGIG